MGGGRAPLSWFGKGGGVSPSCAASLCAPPPSLPPVLFVSRASPAPPLLPPCRLRIHDGKSDAVAVFGKAAKGRLDRCELWGNADSGVSVLEEGDPTLSLCRIRDNAMAGVFVHSTAAGKAVVGADCFFARNAWGDVVRDGEEDEGEYDEEEGEEEEGDEEEEEEEEEGA